MYICVYMYIRTLISESCKKSQTCHTRAHKRSLTRI